MPDENKDQLTEMLENGWAVAGYSSCIMAAGALAHNVLLQKGAMLANITVVLHGEKELGRTVSTLAPQAPKELGFFEKIKEDEKRRKEEKEQAKLAKKERM